MTLYGLHCINHLSTIEKVVTTKKSKKVKQPSQGLFKTIVYILLGIILLAAMAGMLIRHFRHITK